MKKITIDPFSLRPADPFPLREVMVGREQEMSRLEHHFVAEQRRLAQIVGARGSGKTMLAQIYAQSAVGTFPGGIAHLYPFSPQPISDIVAGAFPQFEKGRHLAILDDMDRAPTQDVKSIPELLRRENLLSILLLTDEPLPIRAKDMLSISLGGVSRHDFREIIRRRLEYAGTDSRTIDRLFALSEGNPFIARAASQSVAEGLITLQEFLWAFRDFDYRAILGPDGQPVGDGLVVPEPVVVSVTDVNAELLARLKSNPELLRTLTSRKFEEVVAELLSKQGFSVELTPPSQDGGFDMYVARHDGLGQFLYLVECKRYTPPQRVGVQIVRALHGVVQQKRANAGIIATTSFFTKGAREIQQELKHQLQLRDYIELQKWLGIV